MRRKIKDLTKAIDVLREREEDGEVEDTISSKEKELQSCCRKNFIGIKDPKSNG